MRHPQSTAEETVGASNDPLARAVQLLAAHLERSRVAAERVEQQVIPLLERIALALERGGGIGAGRSPAAEARAAIEERAWDRAAGLIDGLAGLEGSESTVEPLRNELQRARDRVRVELIARIDAARTVGDADGAMVARDELTQLLALADLQEVDRGMIRWLMQLVQRRLRSVPVGADVATLAGAIADRFKATPEGASLRAALPTLRRSAGLCPRCAKPYVGVDEACPECLAVAGMTPTAPPVLTFVVDDLDEVIAEIQPIDLNDAQNWQLPEVP